MKPKHENIQKRNRIIYRIVVNIMCIAVGIFIIVTSVNFAFDVLHTSETRQSVLAESMIIEERAGMFSNHIHTGRYLRAYDTMMFIKEKNEDGAYDDYIKDMEEILMADFEVISQTLSNQTINDSLRARIIGLQYFEEYLYDALKQSVEDRYEDYVEMRAEYHNTANYIRNAKLFDFFNDTLENYLTTITMIYEGRTAYQRGITLMDRGSYVEAISYFEMVKEDDFQFYVDAQKRIEESKNLVLDSYLERVEPLLNNSRYQDALFLLNQVLDLFPEDNRVHEKIQQANRGINALSVYTGPIVHLSFRSLVTNPTVAFDQSDPSQNFRNERLTVEEFTMVLQRLYDRGFVLYDIRNLLAPTGDMEITSARARTILVPPGKKPLILSMDKVSYFESTQNEGFARKLVIDQNGSLAHEVFHHQTNDEDQDSNTEEALSYNADVMTVLHRFVEQNPDFSFQSAMGIIGLTGSNGILGYRTHRIDASDYQQQRAQTQRIAEKLADEGWLFANQSYTYNPAFADEEFDISLLHYDTDQWEREVQPLVGETIIYFTPYGYMIEPGSDKLNYLQSRGYFVLCSIRNHPHTQFTSNVVLTSRIMVDGESLSKTPEIFYDILGTAPIPLRMPIEPIDPVNDFDDTDDGEGNDITNELDDSDDSDNPDDSDDSNETE